MEANWKSSLKQSLHEQNFFGKVDFDKEIICPSKCGALSFFSTAKLFAEKLACQLFFATEIFSIVHVNDMTKIMW